MTHDTTTTTPALASATPVGFLSRPERLRGRDLTEARAAYRAYLAGGSAAWDAYDALRADGWTPDAAAAWAPLRAKRLAVTP